MPNEETSNIQQLTIEYLDDGQTEVELVISADVEGQPVRHIEIGVLAQGQYEGYPRIEEYEKAVLQSMRAAITHELTRIGHIEGRYSL